MKTIMLLSGGMDSATALWSIKGRCEIRALSFKFGKSNRNEIKAARRLAKLAGVREHTVIDVKYLREISEIMPAEEVCRLGVPPCYIPSRNAIFFGIAAYFAEIDGAEQIVTGHNAEDSFPDSKKEYLMAMSRVLSLGSVLIKKGIDVVAPFSGMNKTQILALAIKLGVPLESTWSCHKDGMAPCGSCNGCLDLQRAEKELGRARMAK
jgi:7-cyano-7-deazaguanine synthase